MNSLTIVIVNYNSREYLSKCIGSIYAETQIDGFQVVIVDNGSHDQDFSDLKSRYPQIHFILNRANLGFARACNQGLQAYPAGYYLLLNPDCEVLDGAADKALSFIECHPEIGIVGCRVNNPDGSLQLACRRSIPRPSTALYRFLGLSFLFPGNPKLARYNLSFMDERKIHEVEAVSGSFLLFRDALGRDIGLLDERFFLYGEDLDFCYRALQHGWKIYYYPEAEVIHHKRRSSSLSVKASTHHYYNAMEIFYRKHYGSQSGPLQSRAVITAIRLLRFLNRWRGMVGSDR
ncbi:MAG: glycosyltransferase family 2 protein [Acidobacteriota bacterium]